MFILSCKQDVQGKKIYLVHIVYYTSYHIKMGLIYGRCRDEFVALNPKYDWIQAQYNKFVESGLKKLGSNDWDNG